MQLLRIRRRFSKLSGHCLTRLVHMVTILRISFQLNWRLQMHWRCFARTCMIGRTERKWYLFDIIISFIHVQILIFQTNVVTDILLINVGWLVKESTATNFVCLRVILHSNRQVYNNNHPICVSEIGYYWASCLPYKNIKDSILIFLYLAFLYIADL